MKIREGFMLREIVGTWVIVPIGERTVEFKNMMTLNNCAALIWKQLETGADIDELVSQVIKEYNVDENTARADIEEFLALIKEKGILEYD